jgi:hypothetical protein
LNASNNPNQLALWANTEPRFEAEAAAVYEQVHAPIVEIRAAITAAHIRARRNQ